MSYLDYLLTDEVFDGEKHYREISWWKTLVFAGPILLLTLILTSPPNLDTATSESLMSLAIAIFPLLIILVILSYSIKSRI